MKKNTGEEVEIHKNTKQKETNVMKEANVNVYYIHGGPTFSLYYSEKVIKLQTHFQMKDFLCFS
jgi:hypothetical protein